MDGGYGQDADSYIITVYCADAKCRRLVNHIKLLCQRGFAVL